jgi:hypothetical protein
MKTLAAISIMCFLAIPGLARQQRSAWWVTAQFEATDTTIEGIPAKDLDRTWVAASPLREEVLEASAGESGRKPERPRRSISA